jgi:hypothetical protein
MEKKIARNLIKIIKNLENLKKEKMNSISTKINKVQTKKIPSAPRKGKKKFSKNKRTFTISLATSKPMMKRTILNGNDNSSGLNHARKIKIKPIKSPNNFIKNNFVLLNFISKVNQMAFAIAVRRSKFLNQKLAIQFFQNCFIQSTFDFLLCFNLEN